MSGINNISRTESELSFKELILQVRVWNRFLLSKWKLLLVVAIVGGVSGYAYASIKKPKYAGSLDFVLEDTKSSPLGAYSSLAAQFGLDLGGGGPSGVFNGDNVIEFLKSRFIIGETLLTDTIFNGQRKSLADIYLETYNWKLKWTKREDLSDFSFPIGIKYTQLNRLQDSIMTLLYHSVKDVNLVVSRPDKKLSFVSVTTTSLNELFSKLFTDRLVQAATDFYIKSKTQHAQITVDKLQAQADSLLKLLDNKTYSVAVNQDINLNPAKRVAMINEQVATREQAILATMYSEVVRNLETSKLTLEQETPIIQVVDYPTFPLEVVKPGKITMGVSLAVILVILVSLFLLMRRYLQGV